ncbi:hypothetical protein N7454_008301 [Penicillium verhagenii]|nr:hypothetical protein N7454_008301 [Penicillium verhagenii]
MDTASYSRLFNTSWTLHHCESLLNNQSALNTYATRLRDQLTGDVLAGLQATASAADDDALSKTGSLKECRWHCISAGSSTRDASPSRRAATSPFPGILVTLQYENITYEAALLAETDSNAQREPREGSTYLPLLLTKCPNALRQTLISFLSSNFDTYCAPLRLPSAFLCQGLEVFVDVLRSESTNDEIVEDVIKELQLTLAFSALIAPALRTLNVSISRASLTGFLRAGKSSSRRTLKQKLDSPLIANITSYLETHLAMQLDLKGSSKNQPAKQHVRLSKASCGAFVLGSEGRMKLVVDVSRTEDQDEDGVPAKNKLVLRASETLLRAVVSKAVIGDQSAS